MKLSRNVLVGSLATVGMVLGAVAPAVTAQAATTTGSIDKDGNVTHVDKTEIGNLSNQDNGQLAIAYESETGKGDGEATATSNAAVKVVSGVLVLNEVPDFNFGNAVSGQTKNLVDNTKDGNAVGTDGNSEGNLSVLESRDLTKAGGFQLQAQLGNFVDASTGKDQTLTTSPFTLNLAAQSITDGQNPITGLNTSAVGLTSGGAANTVMSVTPDSTSYKDGEYLATYKSSGESADGKSGANLVITSDIPAASQGKVSSLNAPITWTLTALPKTTTQG